jgi:ABC-type branched-subunit amino acid transport system substrate-binding protein
VSSAACAALRAAGSGADAALEDPVLSQERPSRSAEVTAARLYETARQAQAAGDLAAARTAAAEVVERYPGAPVSGRALRLLTDVAYAQESWQEADLLAQRWIRLVRENDPRVPPLRLIQGEARLRGGDPAGALDRLAPLPSSAPPEVTEPALEVVRRAGAQLGDTAIAARLAALPADHVFRVPLLAAHARALYNEGETERARAVAEAALGAGAAGSDATVSRGVLDGRVDEALGLTGPLTVLGVLLPRTGPPSLVRFAAEVEEGVRAAVASARWPGRLEVIVQDDRGTADGAAAGMVALEEAGAVAVVGPLDEPELTSAVRARRRPIPILSPTAPGTGAAQENVYTLGGLDLEGARALARWSAASGLLRVVLLHPRGEPEQEAQAFEDALRAQGGAVLGRFVYDRGTTYFETQMRAVEALRPDALVLPIPAEDVATVAPQVSFIGLDTLDIRVLGTAGWTRDDVLARVSQRHTDGVVAVTADPPADGEGDGMRALVAAYEELYRRTLRSGVPAVGYDAASLLLDALRSGARTPAAVAASLDRIDTFAGATGQLGVEGGRITRRHQVVCVQDRTLLPVRPGERPVLVDRRPVVLPGEKPPALEGLPFQVFCPGRAPGEG